MELYDAHEASSAFRRTRVSSSSSFAPACSFLNPLDPRARLLALLGLTVCALLIPSASGLMIFCLCALVLVGFGLVGQHAGLRFRQTLRALCGLNVFLSLLWLTLPCTVAGAPYPVPQPLAGWLNTLGLTCSQEGLELARLLTLKSNAAMLVLLGCCGSMSVHAFGSALQGLGCPQRLVMLFMLFCRHIACLREEYRMALQALRLRTAGQERSLRRLQLYACLVGSVLVRSVDKAELVRMALLCKPDVPLYTTGLRLHWTWRETLVCVSVVCLLVHTVWGTGFEIVIASL